MSNCILARKFGEAGPDINNIIHQESKRGIADYTVPQNCFLISSVRDTGTFEYYVKVDGIKIHSSYSSVTFPYIYLKKGQVVGVNQAEGIYTMTYYKIKII